MFARYLETVSLPVTSNEPAEAQAFATQALDTAIECLSPEVSLVDRLELGRIVGAFSSDPVRQYATETRLVRSDPTHGSQLTNLGRTLLALRGRDAIRWLLTVELSQSTGRRDPWRTPRSLLQEALDGIDQIIGEDDRYFEFASQTLERLTELHILSPTGVTPDSELRRYEVSEGMQDLVRAVLETGPWHAVVAALLDDETAAALRSPAPSTAAASDQLTKLITHEVRKSGTLWFQYGIILTFCAPPAWIPR